jgi:histone acetyltransferase (RNA polymerase elongator complex component)
MTEKPAEKQKTDAENRRITAKRGKTAKAILPFFIPMEGCPYQCVYCEQRVVSGSYSSPRREEIIAAVEKRGGEDPCEAAFYGGSFTLLPRKKQEYYLDALKPFLTRGTVEGIRISTHPKGINRDILDFLRHSGVKTIELGVQSFDDETLNITGRGYSAKEAFNACLLIKEAGFKLGIQLMIGLMGDNRIKALSSAFTARLAAADMIRIYPLLILKNTFMAKLWANDGFKAMELEEAVTLCAAVYGIFKHKHIPVIRMGLNPSLSLEENILAGPYHPSFGYLAACRLKKTQIENFLSLNPGLYPLIETARRELPLTIGYKRSAAIWLKEKYGTEKIRENPLLPPGALRFVNARYNSLLSPEETFLAAEEKALMKEIAGNRIMAASEEDAL